MVKTIHAKFLRILLLLICFTLLCCLSACGNKADLTSTSATGVTIAIAASQTSVTAGQPSVITATITDSSGTAVPNVTVTFSFATGGKQSGSPTIVTLNNGTTDADGKAIAIYTAGSLSGTDSIVGTVSSSGSSSANSVQIAVTTTSSSTGYQLAITASPSSVSSGLSSVITATLRDGSGNALSNKTVSFAFVNSSTNGSLSAPTAITDANGNAVVVYTAGTVTSTVQDIIQASFSSGGYSAAADAIVTITSSATTTTTTGYQLAITASPSSVSSGLSSVITATLKDGSGNPLSNRSVSFAFLNSGYTGTLSASTAITDASGNAVVVYTAGTVTAATQDIIQASYSNTVSGTTYYATADAIVNVTPITTTTTTTGYKLVNMAASPSSVSSELSSVIMVTLEDGSGNPLSNRSVSFAFLNSGYTGTLSASTATTDASGNAVVVYTAGTVTAATQDIIQASYSNTISGTIYYATADAIVNVTPTTTTTTTTGYQLAITASPSSVSSGLSSVITATLKDGSGNPLSNRSVSFAFLNSGYTGTLSASTAITDASGNAVVVYTAGTVTAATQDIIQASYSNTVSGTIYYATADAIVNVTPTATTTTTTGYKLVSLAASPSTITANEMSVITVTLEDGSGTILSGQPVTFTFLNSGHTGSLSAPSAITDANGNATVVYTAGAVTSSTQDTIQASYSNTISGTTYYTTADAIVTINPSTSASSIFKLTIAANPSSQSEASLPGVSTFSSVITASVTDSSGNAQAHIPVTFNYLIQNPGSGFYGTDTSGTQQTGVTAITVYTDSNGNATVTDTMKITGQDVIQATVNSTYSTDVIVTLTD